MPKTTFDSKARAAVAEALAPVEWKEAVKTTDEDYFMEITVKTAIVEAEVVTGPHKEAADQAFEAARTQRETAGTLLEGAFDDRD